MTGQNDVKSGTGFGSFFAFALILLTLAVTAQVAYKNYNNEKEKIQDDFLYYDDTSVAYQRI
jgi:hypothetical protein